MAMIDKVLDAATELTAIQLRVAIPAMMALERFDRFVAHNLRGMEPAVAVMLTGPVTEQLRIESALADLAGAARAISIDAMLAAVPADAALDAIERTMLGQYYLAAVNDVLRERGYRRDDADLSAPSWAEQPELVMAKIQASIVSGRDPRAEYQAALSAAVVRANLARAVLAEQPEAIRDQFEALLVQARAATALLSEVDLLVDQRMRSALRTTFLKAGTRLMRVGLLARADDVVMLELDEIIEAVATLPTEASIAATRMRVLEREALIGRCVAVPAIVDLPPVNIVERAIVRAVRELVA
jgi:hypothetical protein